MLFFKHRDHERRTREEEEKEKNSFNLKKYST